MLDKRLTQQSEYGCLMGYPIHKLMKRLSKRLDKVPNDEAFPVCWVYLWADRLCLSLVKSGYQLGTLFNSVWNRSISWPVYLPCLWRNMRFFEGAFL